MTIEDRLAWSLVNRDRRPKSIFKIFDVLGAVFWMDLGPPPRYDIGRDTDDNPVSPPNPWNYGHRHHQGMNVYRLLPHSVD